LHDHKQNARNGTNKSILNRGQRSEVSGQLTDRVSPKAADVFPLLTNQASCGLRDILKQMPRPLTLRFRLLGLLPLVFFLAQTAHYRRVGGMGNLLWMCNVGNLLLAIGLLFAQRELIRAAAIWTIPGLMIWIRYVVLEYDYVFSSFLAHVGGIAIGLIALRRVRMDRLAWFYAYAWYLLAQLAARLCTAPELNVNLAFRIQPGWEQTFSSYWKFWIVLSVVVAASLWVIGKVPGWLWPDKVSEARA
jgi:hypothetical protein